MSHFRWAVLGANLFLVALCAGWWAHVRRASSADDLLLLLPDGISVSDPKVTVWLDAASEEGLHVVPVHDSEFVRPLFSEASCAGVILPDSIHQQTSDAFLTSLRRFVSDGGRLMLVYDAATLSLSGRYSPNHSRLSDLAGVNYALYDTLREKSILWDSVSATPESFQQLDIPPGKYYPFAGAMASEANSTATDGTAASAGIKADSERQRTPSDSRLRRYQYGDLSYPSFVTAGEFSGRVILHSRAGVVAAEHSYEKGFVLFVNLPLGYLKANTDGLLLHAFLKYFATRVAFLPFLMAVPDGVGGVVLNWHVDSNAAIQPLQEIASWGLLNQGPYSIHITAGPDASEFGDGRGFDLDHKDMSQQLVHEYVGMGNAIGSHGGWIHDYFSAHVDKDDPKGLQQLLELNQQSLERATGKPVVEYSAPSGNQPKWLTQWLESHGFVAYYFTGDTGMGPTQGYRDGAREGRNIWAFPVTHLDRAAAFEEMSAQGYSNEQVGEWLRAVTEFTADHHAVRLVYFHPPGILEYRDIVSQWIEETARLRAAGRFRWYTMTQLAEFLNSRKQVHWSMSRDGGTVTIKASHPQTLEHMTWRFPFHEDVPPVVLRGAARVSKDNNSWMVIAGAGKELEFKTRSADR
jgi:hypothetical protein